MEHMMKNEESYDEKKMNEEDKLDSIIEIVESYIADSSLVTEKTLKELKKELLDLRELLFMEETDEPEKDEKTDKSHKPASLIIEIARREKNEK